jgi:uncharacterized protein YegP (UPF0339 family)
VVCLGAKYQVYRDVSGKFRFRLRAENNKIVAVSQAYESKASCMNGVKSVQSNCESHVEDKTAGMGELTNPKYEVFTDAASKFRFHLRASNGEIIAASEAYEAKSGVLNGIGAVQRSCGAEIEDLTVTQEEAVVEEEMMPVVGDAETMFEFTAPKDAMIGEMVAFRGKLLRSASGEGVAGAPVEIYNADRSFFRDDLLGSGVTNKDGSFSVGWRAKGMHWHDDSVKVYAMFKGTESLAATRSKEVMLTVSLAGHNR